MRRYALLGILALACLTASIWWNPDPGLGYTDDDARMILEARMMATGEWPPHFSGLPSGSTVTSHIGMVTMIAPFANSMVAMHALMAGLFVLCVWLTWNLARDSSMAEHRLINGRRWFDSSTLNQITTAGLVALSPALLSYSCQVMTEIPFTAASLGALVLARRKAWAWAFAAALLSVTFRSIGVTLVAAMLVVWLWETVEKGRNAEGLVDVLIILVATLGFGLAFKTHFAGSVSSIFLRGSPYGPEITWWEFPGRVWANVTDYLFQHGPWTLAPDPHPYVLGVGLLALCFAVHRLFLIRDRLIAVYIGFYMMALMIYPNELAGTRYLLPLLPLLFLGLGTAVTYKHLPMPWWADLPRALSIVSCALLVALYGLFNVSLALKGPVAPPGYQEYFDAAANEVRELTPPDAIIGCRKTSAMRVISGRMALMYPFKDPDAVRKWIVSSGVTHIVVDATHNRQTADYLLPAIMSPARIDRWKQDPKTMILEVKR